MPIVIGGPPSSGSSLLAVILNRHSKIACVQETHLLTKQCLFSDWETEKAKIETGRLQSPGWHQYSKVDLTKPKLDNLHDTINRAGSLTQFANLYFSELAEKQNKTIWAEKTPANVYFFHRIAEGLHKAEFILTIRHPYDIIASLVKRNKSIFDAVSLCLLNMGIGCLQSRHLNIHLVTYETLVESPRACLVKLCDILKLDFEQTMLDSTKIPTVKMEGWKHHEDGPIKNNSINRFEELTTKQQEKILHFCQHIVINPDHLKKYGIRVDDPLDTQININYLINHYAFQKKEFAMQIAFKPKMLKDRLTRMIKSHPSAKPYPIIYDQSANAK